MAALVESDEEDLRFLQNIINSSSDSEFSGFESDEININQIRNVSFTMDQAENDSENPIDTEYGWSREDSPPTHCPFVGNPGLKKQLPDNPEPLDFFTALFDDQMWVLITEQTNLYAQSRIDNENLSPFSRQNKWTSVTVDELKVFIALVIAMGLVQKPDIVDYWAKDDTYSTPFFGKHMTKDRFLLILSNLHLVDNSQPSSGRLHKIKPFVDMLKENFGIYEPEQKLSLDEGTCPFKGRVVFRVYNPSKPNKFGIKIYQICESSSGYCVIFDIYDGTEGCGLYADLVGTPEDAGKTTRLVVGLLARGGMLHKGHIIYLDNYFTSPTLAEELDSCDTYICGTVRSNRQGMPKVFSQTKLKKGDTIYRRKANMLVFKYHEKRDVHFITTCHEATFTLAEKRHNVGETVAKPTAIVDYCRNMGGVDLSDQMLQYYQALRRTVKWWKKLFFHLLNLLVLNAFKLCLKYGDPKGRRSHQKFRASLVRALIESAENAPKPTRCAGRKPEPVGRLQEGNHFPTYIPAKAGAKKARPSRDCVACNMSAKKRVGFKRKQSSYMCSLCEVPLCIPNCFRAYHTYQNYKQHLTGEAADNSDD